MRKLLVALMIVAFAATAFADVKLSGTYKVRGNYDVNVSETNDDSDDKNMYYDHDLDIWLKASTDKNTYFKAKLELADEQWGTNEGADVLSGEVGSNEHDADGTGDKNDTNSIELERAYLGHNFGVTTLEVGIMSGGGWSYAFGNDVSGKFRVKSITPAGPGKVIAFVQKNKEGSFADSEEDAEKDDSDVYFIGYKGKFGGIMVTPSVKYVADGSIDSDDEEIDKTVTNFDIGIGGSFGAIGFESEFIYNSVDMSDVDDSTKASDDYDTYGIYLNVFGKMAGAKVGFITAYSSVDEDTDNAQDMGADFDDDFFLVLGDKDVYGEGLPGLWANGVYAEYAVNKKLTVDGHFFYAMSNYDDNSTDWKEDEDTTAYELGLGLTYKITGALKYGVDFGYAKADVDVDGMDDPDAAMVLQHYLKLSF